MSKTGRNPGRVVEGLKTVAALQTVVFDISGHGFGHLGQAAPVIQALAAEYPHVRIVVRSAHPKPLLRDFLGCDVVLAPPPPEATMVMDGPTAVDAARSAEAHRQICDHWEDHVAREAERLAGFGPAILVSDVSYLSLGAAKRLGIPAVALCSLNWGDIVRAYCGTDRGTAKVLDTIDAAYAAADLFLQVEPHMPMERLPNRRPIGPLARIGRARRGDVAAAADIPEQERLVLVSLGGIPGGAGLTLPSMPGVHWLAGVGVSGPAGAVTDAGSLGIPFVDLLASSDAVVTKVGYSTFVEAACNGTPLISAPRDDWPESPYLMDWAQQNACFALAPEGLAGSGLARAVETVLSAPRRAPVAPAGVGEACGIIAEIGGLR